MQLLENPKVKLIVPNITDESENMRFTIILVLLYSCFSTKRIKNQSYSHNDKQLQLLHSFKSSDSTINNRVITFYNSLNLKKETYRELVKLSVGDQVIYEGGTLKYHLQLEVFDSSFLFVSIFPGISSASGFDHFERDSIIVINLSNCTKYNVKLKNIYLTRSSKFLINNYPFVSEDELNVQKYRYCAIDSIDFIESKIILTNQALKQEIYQLREFKK